MTDIHRQPVVTEAAPLPIGPYSQAIHSGGFIFVSGQLGSDPATGQLVPGGIEAQTEQVLKNLKAILESAGTSLENVVKTTVFMSDFDQFSKMNAIYATYFPHAAPARSAFQVVRLPLNAAVEIEAIAKV